MIRGNTYYGLSRCRIEKENYILRIYHEYINKDNMKQLNIYLNVMKHIEKEDCIVLNYLENEDAEEILKKVFLEDVQYYLNDFNNNQNIHFHICKKFDFFKQQDD